MKTLTREQVSRYYNTQIGRTDGSKPTNPTPEGAAEGERRRAIQALNDNAQLEQELKEVWE